MVEMVEFGVKFFGFDLSRIATNSPMTSCPLLLLAAGLLVCMPLAAAENATYITINGSTVPVWNAKTTQNATWAGRTSIAGKLYIVCDPNNYGTLSGDDPLTGHARGDCFSGTTIKDGNGTEFKANIVGCYHVSRLRGWCCGLRLYDLPRIGLRTQHVYTSTLSCHRHPPPIRAHPSSRHIADTHEHHCVVFPPFSTRPTKNTAE